MADVWFDDAGARGLLALLDPRFHFGRVPYDAAGRQVEAARDLAAALHFIDRRFSQRDYLMQFVASDGAAEGRGLRWGNCGSAS